jgi:hypothetical protein
VLRVVVDEVLVVASVVVPLIVVAAVSVVEVLQFVSDVVASGVVVLVSVAVLVVVGASVYVVEVEVDVVEVGVGMVESGVEVVEAWSHGVPVWPCATRAVDDVPVCELLPAPDPGAGPSRSGTLRLASASTRAFGLRSSLFVPPPLASARICAIAPCTVPRSVAWIGT